MTVAPCYLFKLSCLECGSDLEHRATGAPLDDGREIRAIADCRSCRLEHRVRVVLDARSTRPRKFPTASTVTATLTREQVR